jgi:HAD superfamily phosphoserine phosphatase-like hydrolase
MTFNDDRTADHESKPHGIVFFDYGGVLCRANTWHAVHQMFGTVEEADEFADRYHADELSFTEWGELDANLWEDKDIETFYQTTDQMRIINGLRETVTTLKQWGFITGIVSAGIFELITETVGEQSFDFVIGNEIGMKNDTLTGNISMNVTDIKKNLYQDLAKRYEISLQDSVTIADSRDDFHPIEQGLNIGFNANEQKMASITDSIINGDDIREVLPVIKNWYASTNSTK